MSTAAEPRLLLKRGLLKAFAVGAAAGEVYFAAVEAVLVFDITVFAERRILLVPATIIKTIISAAVIESVITAIKVSAVTFAIEAFSLAVAALFAVIPAVLAHS